ncbi:MAG: hypothetical protein JRH11_22955, partial [Deltaproteobacteria bacterium]|nr:hypothetical protein [Deltaproteobacteria bacterium]
MRFSLLGVLLLTVLGTGCDGGYEVLVSLRTDFAPGADFVVSRTSLEGRFERDERSALFGDPYEAGVLIAELGDLPAAEHALTVRLLNASGALVAERRVRFDLDRDLGMTVLMTQACRGVVCPERQSCAGGICVDDSCTVTPTAVECAPAAECASAVDCREPPASCAESVCMEGTCFSRVIPGSCSPEEYCDVGVGCRLIPVSEPMDSGADAATDAATDAPADAPLDAPRPDTGGGGDAGPGGCLVRLGNVMNTAFGGGQTVWADGDMAVVGLTG